MSSGLETNIYPIQNLAALSSRYRLYVIRGLRSGSDEFFANCARLKRKLSYELHNPVTIVEHERKLCLVVRAEPGDCEPPSSVELVGVKVSLDPLPQTFDLDFRVRTPENDEICLRFLSFMIQEPLHQRPKLWQTQAGEPFFERQGHRLNDDITLYRGFKVRPALTPDGGLGLIVDVSHRFVSSHPLPVDLSRDEFESWKGRSFIYHCGHTWYQIKPDGMDDQTAGEREVPDEGNWLPLAEWLRAKCRKPLPYEIADLAHEASVLIYHNHRSEERSAPSSLCYPLLDVHDPQVARFQSRTILKPEQRRIMVRDFVHTHLNHLRFKNTSVRISHDPVAAPRKMFQVPDLQFGNGQILSVRGTRGARTVSLDALGSERKALLKERSAGFYDTAPMGRQYLVLPQSVFDSWGTRFVCDLKTEVNALYPQEIDYEPQIVTYDDNGPRTYGRQARALKAAFEEHRWQQGCAAIMVHHPRDKARRKEDDLEAFVVRELVDLGVSAAVMHTQMGRESYMETYDREGSSTYAPHPGARGKLSGYLNNVALNKVLLPNERWPFVLATPLHADLIIGVDVKHHHTGMIVVSDNGAKIRTVRRKSRQNEKLSEDQMCRLLIEIVRKQHDDGSSALPRTIVVHRDGRVFDTERLGAHRAIESLKAQNLVAPDATLTLVEIQKTSPVPLRLFDRLEKGGLAQVFNPQVGVYYELNANEGFLCTTGRAFNRRGTIRPLHIRRVDGPLTLEECLEDVYALSALAWTRPEDCLREPITVKLNDRYLSDEAAEYDEEALSWMEEDMTGRDAEDEAEED